jgi:hypothetical protein
LHAQSMRAMGAPGNLIYRFGRFAFRAAGRNQWRVRNLPRLAFAPRSTNFSVQLTTNKET